MTEKRKKYPIALLCLVVLLATACTTDDLSSPTPMEGQAILTAQKSHIITRAGDEVTNFDTGTRYRLWAVEGETSNYDWANAPLNGVEGTEQDNHTIDYGTAIPFSSRPISFFGVTYGTTTPPEADHNTKTPPTRTETVASDGSLPDLMYSNNLLQQTVAHGYRLQMDFKHAMSRLKFMIVKQDESEDAEEDKKLEAVKLKKIVVKGTHGSGTLDIVQGTWSYTDDVQNTIRTAYDSQGNDMEITTTSVNVEGETLIFPNTKEEEVTITVTLTGLAEGEKSVDYKLRSVNEEGTDMGVFRFEQNHEYTLLITVLKDDVRTIAIAPQVYEWIDEDRTDNYLGQPVTFANLMWMDRNLGAKSADCENDWENCRGYYYQYGRNIPYILDMDKYEIAVKGSSKYEFLYTYNQYGEKVYGGLQANSTKKITMDDGATVNIPVKGTNNIAINPGDDVDIYEFIYDNGNGIWLYEENGSHTFNNTYWMESSENHPCPKGWRLPTEEDFATFLPDYTFKTNPWYEGFHHPAPYTGDISKYPEEVIYGTVNGEKAFYLIKRQGRTDCYRIRILLKASKGDVDKQYYEFTYFAGDEKMTFDGISEENQADLLTKFDWSTPSAMMEIPCVGFIHPHNAHKLDGDGVNAILRTSQTGSGIGTNWVFYLRNDWQFGLINTSRRALGDQIRCVRDITAN